jgi:hypothetical protein
VAFQDDDDAEVVEGNERFEIYIYIKWIDALGPGPDEECLSVCRIGEA